MRSILDWLEARNQHRKWVEWEEEPPDKRSAKRPPPAFKDCDSCPILQEEERFRRNTCRTACLMEGLPAGPDAHFHVIEQMAFLPDDAVPSSELSYREARDLTIYKRKRFSFG